VGGAKDPGWGDSFGEYFKSFLETERTGRGERPGVEVEGEPWGNHIIGKKEKNCTGKREQGRDDQEGGG